MRNIDTLCKPWLSPHTHFLEEKAGNLRILATIRALKLVIISLLTTKLGYFSTSNASVAQAWNVSIQRNITWSKKLRHGTREKREKMIIILGHVIQQVRGWGQGQESQTQEDNKDWESGHTQKGEVAEDTEMGDIEIEQQFINTKLWGKYWYNVVSIESSNLVYTKYSQSLLVLPLWHQKTFKLHYYPSLTASTTDFCIVEDEFGNRTWAWKRRWRVWGETHPSLAKMNDLNTDLRTLWDVLSKVKWQRSINQGSGSCPSDHDAKRCCANQIRLHCSLFWSDIEHVSMYS